MPNFLTGNQLDSGPVRLSKGATPTFGSMNLFATLDAVRNHARCPRSGDRLACED